MKLLTLLALLPLIAATPSPEPPPYNPFFQPNSSLNGPIISHDQLVSRAQLEAIGREALALEPIRIGAQAAVPVTSDHTGLVPRHGGMEKRGKGEGKRGTVRKVVRRGASCPTVGAGPVLPSASASTASKATATTKATASSIAFSTVPSSTGKFPTPSSSTKSDASSSSKKPLISSISTKSAASPSSTKSVTTTTSAKSTKPTTASSTKTPTTSSSATTKKQQTSSAVKTPTSSAVPSPAATQGPAPAKLYTVDPAGNGPFSGWGTWFETGLGACGWYNTAADPLVAISAQVFDNWPGWHGLNPNQNPICGQHLEIKWGGKSLVVQVADRCPGCAPRSLDLSVGAFQHFAGLDVGLLGMDSYTKNITWSWVEGKGALPQVRVG